MKLTGHAPAAPVPPCRVALIADEFVPGAGTRHWHWNVTPPERHKP